MISVCPSAARAAAARRRTAARLGAGLLGLVAAFPGGARAQLGIGEPLSGAPVPTRAMPDGFTLAAVGDLIYLRPMLATLEKQSPDMLKLLRGADVTFGNFETSAVDLKTFSGAPQAESGGTWMLADPAVIPDLKAMGFDIVSHANNHATDWGVEGLLETIKRLDTAGLVNAGTGRNMGAARAPHYFDGASGRVALVAGASSYTPMSRAADPLGETPGRPGVNALGADRVAIVSQAQYDMLAKVAVAAPGRAGNVTAKGVNLFGTRYRVGASATDEISFSYSLKPGDLRANLLAVRQGKQNSNFAVYSLHNHESGTNSQLPADFAVEMAHKVIDEGADVFIGHGPHQLRGIEIYKGKPIFYSLGNFAMMNNSLDVAPPDMYEQYELAPGAMTVPELLQARNAKAFSDRALYESVIAVSRYVGGQVAEIRLYPIDLGISTEGADRGVPKMADAEKGRLILERMQKLSAPFGTRITIDKGVGVIRTGANSH